MHIFVLKNSSCCWISCSRYLKLVGVWVNGLCVDGMWVDGLRVDGLEVVGCCVVGC